VVTPLVVLAESLDEEQIRAVREGRGEDELARVEILCRENISEEDHAGEAGRHLLASLTATRSNHPQASRLIVPRGSGTCPRGSARNPSVPGLTD
jgi:hypothetical protein